MTEHLLLTKLVVASARQGCNEHLVQQKSTGVGTTCCDLNIPTGKGRSHKGLGATYRGKCWVTIHLAKIT